MMYGRILKRTGDLGEVHGIFPDHLLAFLQLDAADVFAGRNLQILMEQGGQIAGADIHIPGNQGYGQLFPNVGADVLLGSAKF